jgi:hypothetical protein
MNKVVLNAAQVRVAEDEALLQKVRQRIATLPELDRIDVDCHAVMLRQLLERKGDAMWLAVVLVFREKALENSKKALSAAG